MSGIPHKARVQFPDVDGNGEWLEVEVRDHDAFIESFIKASLLNHLRKKLAPETPSPCHPRP